jgi:hypothetical protein
VCAGEQTQTEEPHKFRRPGAANARVRPNSTPSHIMNLRAPLATAAVVDLLITSGCLVMGGQETVGAYIGDAIIPKAVDAGSIKVETTR